MLQWVSQPTKQHGIAVAPGECSPTLTRAHALRSVFEPLSICGAEHATENNTARYTAFMPDWTGPLPWSFQRAPDVWENRLGQYWRLRGVNVTGAYMKVWCDFREGLLPHQLASARDSRTVAGSVSAYRISTES